MRTPNNCVTGMSTKQSFGLVVLHFASYANVLMSGHAVLPRTSFVLPGLHDRLRRRLCCVKFMSVFFFATGSFEPVFKSSCQLFISAWDVKNCAWTEHRGINYKGDRKSESYFEHFYPLLQCVVTYMHVGTEQGSFSRLDLSTM